VVLIFLQSKATDYVWSGLGDGTTFSDPNNWVGNVVPASSSTTRIIFGDGPGGLTGLINIDLDVNRNVGQIVFQTDDATYDISSFGQAFGVFDIMSLGLINNNNLTATIDADVRVRASQTWNAANGDFSVGGGVNLFANSLTIDGAHSTTFGGIVSGSGPIYKIGSGTLTFAGANTFSGGLTVGNGRVVLATDTAAGAGTINLTNGATLEGSGGTRSIANAVNVGPNGGVISGSGVLRISGVISGDGLTKNGSGTLEINANNNTLGSLTLAQGHVSLTGAGGNLLSDTAVLHMAGGTLDMNDKTETIGTLDLASGTSVINLEPDSTPGTLTFSQLSRNGGTLTIFGWKGTAGSSGTDDRIFLDAPATIPEITFDGFAPGATLLNTGEIVPTAVPEPNSVAFFSMSLLGFALWGILRRRDR
jgi:autotransporter-associated beta strand protein